VDESYRLVGVITVADLGQLARDDEHLGPLLVASDIAQQSEIVSPGDSLLEAIRKMGVRGAESTTEVTYSIFTSAPCHRCAGIRISRPAAPTPRRAVCRQSSCPDPR